MYNSEVKEKHDETMRSERVRKSISCAMKKIRHDTKDYVTIHRGYEGKRVHPKLVDAYLNDGWEIGSNQKGMIVLHKNDKETKIRKEELDKYLSEGWIKGAREGRITKELRIKLDNSHKNISNKFKIEQSIRLKNFYKNNPDFINGNAIPVKIYNDDEVLIFNSCSKALEFLNYSPSFCKSSSIRKMLEKGFITKKGPYFGWKIMRIEKGSDSNEKICSHSY